MPLKGEVKTVPVLAGDLSFLPDWSSCWTANEAEEQLAGFKFQGPGWYFLKIDDDEIGFDKLLVVPDLGPTDTVENSVWQQKWMKKGRKFWFHVFNSGRDPMHAFNSIVNAPTRQDDRV